MDVTWLPKAKELWFQVLVVTSRGASGGRDLASESGRALVHVPRCPLGTSTGVAQPTG